MLRFIRQGQRWLVTALVAAIGGVFVLFFGPWDFSRNAGSTNTPISVDGVQYTSDDLARVRSNIEQQYRDSLGDQFDAVSKNLQIPDRAVRQLVDRAILAGEARRMGLAAGTGEVDGVIREAFSGFRDDDGHLDEEQARAYVVYEWGSVRRFKQEVRTDVLLRKLGRVLLGTAGASRAEALDSLRYRGEQVRIAFVALDPTTPPADLEVLPGDVEEFARGHGDQIREAYEADLSRYQLPARIRLRHVLVRVGPEGEEAAREQAEAIRGRIEAGEDMASVARERSDDEGSRKLGGDLGLLPVTEVSRTLRDAVEGIETGALSPVVRGEQGFHVVRLEESRAAETRSLEDVTLEIAEELQRHERATTWATERADALEQAIAKGESLEDAARELRLNIERTDFFQLRPDGFIPDLGDSVEVQTAAFAARLAHPTWPYPLAVGDKTVFIQLLERRDPDPAALEAGIDAERDRLTQEAQQRAEQLWLADRRTQLQAEGRIYIDPAALQ